MLLESERRQKETVPRQLLQVSQCVLTFSRRQRAEQARVLAGQMSDATSREMMLGIAQDYERLAEQAEQRAREERKKRES
jgi:hypothetical protein